MYKGTLVKSQLYRSDQSMTKAAKQSPKPNRNKSTMGMEVLSCLSRRSPSSDLNPNAPIFVPLAYRTVEDFSEQWWDLVKSSPWFRDYWLQERYQQEEFLQEQIEAEFDFDDFIDDAFCINPQQNEEEKKGERGGRMDVVKFGVEKWNGRGWEGPPKYATKTPKIVNLKRVSPRVIQQPR